MHNPIPLRLKTVRKKAKITQKNLGLKIGIEETSASGRMNHYEQGNRIPDLFTLDLIGKELNVPLHYFYCKNDIDAELVCLIDKLSESEKEKLIKLFRTE